MVSRRSFLKTGAMLTTTAFLPEFKHSKIENIQSANDQVNVALIGCRNMGWANLTDFLKHSNVNCVALCDVNKEILQQDLEVYF